MSNELPRAWDFDDDDFFEIDGKRRQLEFLLQYAVLAPSTHNSQPWSFRINPDGVDVLADESRALPVADPEHRELYMSLGAAIANFRVAAAHFGFDSTLSFPAEAGGSIAASIQVTETSAPDRKLSSLFWAIRRRRTNRQSFSSRPIQPEAMAAVLDCAERFDETFSIVMPQEQKRMAEVIAFAEKTQMRDRGYRAELSSWVRSQGSEATDGLPAERIGFHVAARAARFVLRYVDLGAWQAWHDRGLAVSASCLIVVSGLDDRVSLIQAGESLELLLLTITRSGLQYSFLNGPVQVAGLRDRVATVTGVRRLPQLILRVGPGHDLAGRTPRRPVQEVLRP